MILFLVICTIYTNYNYYLYILNIIAAHYWVILIIGEHIICMIQFLSIFIWTVFYLNKNFLKTHPKKFLNWAYLVIALLLNCYWYSN